MASSMGGLWSVALALYAPGRVSQLVLAGAPPGVVRSAPLPLRMLGLPLVGPLVGRLMMANPTRDGSRKFWGQMLVAHPERLDEALLDADVAHTRRNYPTILGLIRCAVDAGGLRRRLILGERWEAVSVPTVFLCGERDAFMTPEMDKAWEAIAARNPNVRIVRIPDAGHLLRIDEPERVVGEIERFLTT